MYLRYYLHNIIVLSLLVMKIFASIALFIFFSSLQSLAQSDNIVQLTGITMTADSLQAVPDVAVMIKGKDLGTYSNGKGMFSLVCEKGDVITFSQMGYKTVQYQVPTYVTSKYISAVQLMVQDTFYIPETIINPYSPREDILYALKYGGVPDDGYSTMQRNTNTGTMAFLMQTLPRSGPENQQIYQTKQAYQATYYGQQAPIGIFNPLKWNDFFQSWKRGDFKRKK